MKTKPRYIPLYLLAVSVLMSFGGSTPPWEKENVSFPMMNQEIRHTMQENERQVEMKNKQTANTATETVNRSLWTNFKTTTQKIQDRLRFVDFAMQSVPTGYAIFLESQQIAETQSKIIEEVEGSPYLVPIILPSQMQFGAEVQMIVQYIAGIVLSYGAINQMEKAERKILLDYALDEIRRIRLLAYNILSKLIQTKRALEWRKQTVISWVNMDKGLVKEILDNVKF